MQGGEGGKVLRSRLATAKQSDYCIRQATTVHHVYTCIEKHLGTVGTVYGWGTGGPWPPPPPPPPPCNKSLHTCAPPTDCIEQKRTAPPPPQAGQKADNVFTFVKWRPLALSCPPPPPPPSRKAGGTYAVAI